MAVSLIERIYATNFCKFAIDSTEDLQMLPTMNSKGKGNLSTISSCSMASIAIGTNGEDYILNGGNTWIRYTGSFGGSSGGSGSGSGGSSSGSDDGFIEL